MKEDKPGVLTRTVEKAKNEPVVMWAAVSGVILAILNVFQVFNVVDITPDQRTSLEILLQSLGLIIVPMLVALAPRHFVTPVYNPKDNDGNELEPKQ